MAAARQILWARPGLNRRRAASHGVAPSAGMHGAGGRLGCQVPQRLSGVLRGGPDGGSTVFIAWALSAPAAEAATAVLMAGSVSVAVWAVRKMMGIGD